MLPWDKKVLTNFSKFYIFLEFLSVTFHILLFSLKIDNENDVSEMKMDIENE